MSKIERLEEARKCFMSESSDYKSIQFVDAKEKLNENLLGEVLIVNHGQTNEKITLEGHSNSVWSLVVLPNGDLASGSDKIIKSGM